MIYPADVGVEIGGGPTSAETMAELFALGVFLVGFDGENDVLAHAVFASLLSSLGDRHLHVHVEQQL